MSTFMAAPTQISDVLTNLRQSLYEERLCLLRARQYMRQRQRHKSAVRREGGLGLQRVNEMADEMRPSAALTAMSSAIKHMIQRFKVLEEPFLETGIASGDKLLSKRDSRMRRRRRSDKEDEAALGYSSGLGENEDADYLYAENRYRSCGVRERFLWIKHKSTAINLLAAISRMQVRRMGLQISHITLQAREWDRHWDDFHVRLDALDRLEGRLDRVIGVRRVE